jgi:spermidine synthase
LIVPAIFFLSGMPALIYQLTWQRSLFAIYGINIEAVAVVVAGFLAGLGIGSIAGGFVSERLALAPRRWLLLAFGGVELLIGLIGFVSLAALHWIGERTLGLPLPVTTALTLALLAVPTLFMGSTLPILVAYLVRIYGNVGESVGLLYCVNTLGSAFACFLAAVWLMRTAGMQGAVHLAAGINLLVGGGALLQASRTGADAPVAAAPAAAAPAGGRRARFTVAWALAAATGYISLSYELVWFRCFSMAYGTASAFAIVLSAYLLGIAAGSLTAARYCERRSLGEAEIAGVLRRLLFASAVVGLLVLPVAGRMADAGLLGAAMLVLIVVHSACSGAIFPIVAHYGIEPTALAGKKLSQLYLANILGSVAGTLLTGFVLFDQVTLSGLVAILAVLSFALCAVIAWSGLRPARRRLPLAGYALAALAAVVLAKPLFSGLYEEIVYKSTDHARFKDTVENKHGVINVAADDTVYGGGYYDGRVEVDLVDDHNLLIRPFSLSLFHPAPRQILQIGLATGAWAQVLVNNPSVEKLTIVEINDGYIGLIRKYPVVRSLLANPKIELAIDDGRRWLNRHPGRKFDAIVQNTTWNFRANVTNLLSREYLAIVAAHLNDGGVFLYNTTDSARVQRTACEAFPEGYRVINNMMVSNAPMSLDYARLERVLASYRIDGRRVIDPVANAARWQQVLRTLGDPAAEAAAGKVGIEPCPSILARTGGLPLITDDNMGEEWPRRGAP